MPVSRLEEVLARLIGRPDSADEVEDGRGSLLRERGPQTLGECGGLLPIPDQAAAEGTIGLPEPVGGLAPAPQDLLYVGYELPGSQILSPLRRHPDYTNGPEKGLCRTVESGA
jgi:hypothetical protein